MRILLIAFLLSFFSCVTNDIDEYPYDTDLKNLTGLVFPLGWTPPVTTMRFDVGVGIPETFDWRDKGLSAVENQGSCGSCWAMATASVLEDNATIAKGREVDYSEQYLIDCNRDGWSCNGGWAAHDYHLNKGASGAIDGSQYPYTGRDGNCKNGLRAVDKIESWHPVDNNVDSIKHAIYNYGPVWTSIFADGNIQNYRSGVFSKCRQGQSNHAVTLVGWGKDHWIMKNSWGSNWGDRGYMKIKFNCNNIGYASNYIVYKSKPQPDPDPEPTPKPKPKPSPKPKPKPSPKPWYCKHAPWIPHCR